MTQKIEPLLVNMTQGIEPLLDNVTQRIEPLLDNVTQRIELFFLIWLKEFWTSFFPTWLKELNPFLNVTPRIEPLSNTTQRIEPFCKISLNLTFFLMWLRELFFFEYDSKYCKYNTSWYRNSRTNDYDKWLRKSVYDYKHTSNIGETIVDNYVNDATHIDAHKMQTWAHLHAVCSCIVWRVHITFHMAQAVRTCLP